MKIGFTTSIPIEIVLSAGHIPIDLNNVFVSKNSQKYIQEAELFGYPRNICSWIKGMHSVALEQKIDVLIGVVQGDCSNTHSMMDILKNENLPIFPFSYSYNRDYSHTKNEIKKMESYFDVSHKKVIETKKYLDEIRRKLIKLDDLTWDENTISGFENHYWLVSSSDFNSNPEQFEMDLDALLEDAKNREKIEHKYKIAYIGVPPIIIDIYEKFAEFGMLVVFNEVQRQFSMPYITDDIVEQYLNFTYPYSINFRINDILKEINKRKIDGVISYAQAFCHRQIEGIMLKKKIPFPLLTLEADQPDFMDARTKLRIESFLDMLRFS